MAMLRFSIKYEMRSLVIEKSSHYDIDLWCRDPKMDRGQLLIMPKLSYQVRFGLTHSVYMDQKWFNILGYYNRCIDQVTLKSIEVINWS